MSAHLASDGDQGHRWGRWSAIAGVAFAVAFVVGLLIGGGTPAYDAPDQWTEWFAVAANRTRQVIAFFLLLAAALSFVVFVAGFFRRLRVRATGHDGWPTVVLATGVIFAVLTMAGAAAVSTVSAAIQFAPSAFAVPSADVAQVIEQFGFGLLLGGGGWTAAVFVASASLAARGTGALPGWLTAAGFIVAVLLLASPAFVPLLLFPLWVLVVSAVMMLQPSMGPEVS